MVDDVVALAREAHAKHEGLPRLLFGHSMGGCISLVTCVQQPDLFQYATFSAPTTSRPPNVNGFLKAIGGVFATIGPKWRVAPRSDLSTLCRNEQAVQEHFNDPLSWRLGIASGFGYDILTVGDQLIEQAQLFTIPALFISGSADRIVSPEGSYNFFKKCSSLDKTYINLDGWYHWLLNEPDGPLLLPIISTWFEERLALESGATLDRNVYLTGGSTPGELNLQPVSREEQ